MDDSATEEGGGEGSAGGIKPPGDEASAMKT